MFVFKASVREETNFVSLYDTRIPLNYNQDSTPIVNYRTRLFIDFRIL